MSGSGNKKPTVAGERARVGGKGGDVFGRNRQGVALNRVEPAARPGGGAGWGEVVDDGHGSGWYGELRIQGEKLKFHSFRNIIR